MHWPVPSVNPPPDLRMRPLMAGKLFSRAAFAYAGGAFSDRRVFNMGAMLVQHPKGSLLFDAGFGRAVEHHFKTAPALMQMTASYAQESTVAEQLAALGIDQASLMGVVLTHAHWDHVSGLEDLPGVPVWLNQWEWDFVTSGHRSTALARQLIGTQRHLYAFEQGPYLGFAASHDVFGDGSVVLVLAPGHTPGSVIAFINLPGAQRYALVGDLVWQIEGIDLAAEKPWFVRRTADQDAASIRTLIGHLRELKQQVPGLCIVPAHDRRIWERLPR
jgi:glyoxylase-like metal-dependent hydrolase (beta-lactamase superfamily II)